MPSARGHRDGGALDGAARGLAGIPANEVVAAREEEGGGERDRDPAQAYMLGAGRLTDQEQPGGDDENTTDH